jgi:hypothetical protein
MLSSRALCLLPALALAALTARAHAQVLLYDEFAQGDLSDDRFNPTPFNLPVGIAQLHGSLLGDVNGHIDRDYYSITIPQGFVLSHLILEQYFSNDPVAFIAIQPGPIFPNDPTTVTPGELMGWLHFGQDYIGQDLLPLMGAQGQGFTPPIPAGIYSFWTQQTGEPTEYLLDFVVEAPAPAGLLALAALLPWRRRR